ncbi:MAG: hypothetical protein ACI8QC_004325 [Planctomycetota bacterium]|jgi:hypothetical protein
MALPPEDSRIRVVHDFEALANTPFIDGVNAYCWPRVLADGFGEIARLLGAGEGIVTLEDDRLTQLPASPEGRAAVALLLEDQRRLLERQLDPALNIVYSSRRDERAGPIATDVFSFHADSAPVETETWLCTYFGAPSEGLLNNQATRRVDHAETRAELLLRYGGKDDPGFLDYLAEHHYDLHYALNPGAKPFAFGRGHLWRVAVDWPSSPVPPFIHRAPAERPGQSPRLLLIA